MDTLSENNTVQILVLVFGAIFLILWIVWVIRLLAAQGRIKDKNRRLLSQKKELVGKDEEAERKEKALEEQLSRIGALQARIDAYEKGAAVIAENEALARPEGSAEMTSSAATQSGPSATAANPSSAVAQPAAHPAANASAAQSSASTRPSAGTTSERLVEKTEEDISMESRKLFRTLGDVVKDRRIYLREKVSKDELMGLIGVDRKRFDLMLKHVGFDKSLSEYLDSFRIMDVLDLLKAFKNRKSGHDEDMTLDDVAKKAGFSGSGHLGRACKSNFGMSLKELMKIL